MPFPQEIMTMTRVGAIHLVLEAARAHGLVGIMVDYYLTDGPGVQTLTIRKGDSKSWVSRRYGADGRKYIGVSEASRSL